MNIIEEVNTCEQCNLRENVPEGCTPIFGKGYSDADVLIVLDGPTDIEIIYNQPLVGSAEDYLNKVLSDNGISEKQVFITNLIKCPGGTKVGNIKTCSQHLYNQSHIINPKVVVTLGSFANKVDKVWPITTKVFRGKSPKFVMERGKKIKEEFNTLFREVNEWLSQKHSQSA